MVYDHVCRRAEFSSCRETIWTTKSKIFAICSLIKKCLQTTDVDFFSHHIRLQKKKTLKKRALQIYEQIQNTNF